MILDTDVLIWFLRDKEKAVQTVLDAMPFSISIVTYMELLQGMRDKNEMSTMKKAFQEMDVRILPIDEEISEQAAEYVECYALSNSMEMADALIAATCKKWDETLCTGNDKHYKVVDGFDIQIFRI